MGERLTNEQVRGLRDWFADLGDALAFIGPGGAGQIVAICEELLALRERVEVLEIAALCERRACGRCDDEYTAGHRVGFSDAVADLSDAVADLVDVAFVRPIVLPAIEFLNNLLIWLTDIMKRGDGERET